MSDASPDFNQQPYRPLSGWMAYCRAIQLAIDEPNNRAVCRFPDFHPSQGVRDENHRN